jgi:2',3'-cyclic-nucleotide 2'-phosphodiesterase (5'-nucleotidase family)
VRYHLSGVQLEFDGKAPAGSRLRRVTFADRSGLDDRRSYRVVMTDFLASSGDGVALPAGTKSEALDVFDLDALVSYLRARPGGRLVLSETERATRIRRLP